MFFLQVSKDWRRIAAPVSVLTVEFVCLFCEKIVLESFILSHVEVTRRLGLKFVHAGPTVFSLHLGLLWTKHKMTKELELLARVPFPLDPRGVVQNL